MFSVMFYHVPHDEDMWNLQQLIQYCSTTVATTEAMSVFARIGQAAHSLCSTLREHKMRYAIISL